MSDEARPAPAGSWVAGADGSGFGLAHLPLGVVRRDGARRCCARIGDHALDLGALADAGLLGEEGAALHAPVLDPFLTRGRLAWRAIRERLTALLRADADRSALPGGALVALADVECVRPVGVPNYVDFYSSLHHATNVGRMFRPGGEPLPPNWRRLPVGYDGHSTSVVVSGTPVRRPHGQVVPEGGGGPALAPTARLDFELEVGFVTGPGNAPGRPIAIADAAEHVFGLVLVNDWSARDVQVWEAQPLGPFLAKSFATSMGAWITPLEALRPFRVAGPAQDPRPLPYLRTGAPWAFDVALEAELRAGGASAVVTRTSFREQYWTVAQQLAHAAVGGATVCPGDLYASGTVSGPEPGARGCLLELTWNGRDPLDLGAGVRRTWLEDGDEVVLRGRCEAPGAEALTLAEVRGTVLPALSP